MKIMEIRDLHYSYGPLSVLKGVDMDFYKGTFYGILGPNGCGKSTLLKNLYGYLKPSKGSITLSGKNIRNMNPRERARNIAYVPQDSHVGFDFSVLDVIAMGRNPYHSALDNLGSADIAQIEKAMRETSTEHLRNKSINELSGGEKQRALIARAFAQDSDIILMDEPLKGLDIKLKLNLIRIFSRMWQTDKRTVVFVTHDVDEALLLGSDIIVLSRPPAQIILKKRIDLPYEKRSLESEYLKKLEQDLMAALGN